MPSVKQTTVDPAATTRAQGSSSTEGLAAAFPASPIHSGELTRDSVETLGNDLLMQGVVQGGMGIPAYPRLTAMLRLVQEDCRHLPMFLILHHLVLEAKTRLIFLHPLKGLDKLLMVIPTDQAPVHLRILQTPLRQ